MSSSEADKSSKEDKEANDARTPTSQEQISAASGAVSTDWTGFQAYSPMPPHGFLASSPQAHPYMWGVQQFIPPYGPPPHPYVAMYPHGGLYAHPTMTPGAYPFSPFGMPSPNGIAEASGVAPSVEMDVKSTEGKGKLAIKRSKGSLGSLNMITGKKNETGNEPGAATNGAHSKRDESASEGSSEGSDANSQHESQVKSSDRPDSAATDEPSQNGAASQNGGSSGTHVMMAQTVPIVPVPAVGAVSGIPGPPTNLNIGIDYWATATSPTIPALHGKVPAAPVTGGVVAPGTHDRIQSSQMWIQDEREIKRQRRKQSNRESARRSRLRKQAECDELAQRAEALKEENMSLRTEITRLKSEYEQLLAQNASLKERLGELPGHEVSLEEEDGQ